MIFQMMKLFIKLIKKIKEIQNFIDIKNKN